MNMDAYLKLRLRPRLLPLLLSLCSPALLAQTGGITTVTTYDAGNHVTSVTDPRGLVTTYTHDGLDHLLQQASPDTGTVAYAYDGYGRAASMTRADGVQTTYGYDAINRRTSVSAGGQTQTYAYDSCTNGLGRLCSDGDATGTTSYSYTPEGWLAGKGFAIGSTTYALGYAHDTVGHVTAVNYPDGNQAIYAYTNGAVSGVSLKVGGTTVNGATAITYRPMEMAMSAWTSSNGLTNTLSYDTDGRLTGISVPSKQSLGFTYDTADRITQITNGIDATLTQNFGYGGMSRLVSVYSGADNESYQYDANGNRTTGTVNGVTQTYTYSPTSNQLTGIGGGAQYGYDANGNTTLVNGASTYQYDPYTRLDASGGATDYVNPEGQRLRKTGGSTGTTYFAPDQGGALLAEDDNGTWVDYLRLNGRLIGRISGGQVSAIHDDQVGRPEVVTDASQNVLWRAQNFPFTQKIILANITFNLGFPGQYYDAERQTWNNGYRDYVSNAGRYLESDPTGLAGGINTYAYVNGNPITLTDPTGMAYQVALSWSFTMITPWVSLSGGISTGFNFDGWQSSGYNQFSLNPGNFGSKTNNGAFLGGGITVSAGEGDAPTAGWDQQDYIEFDADILWGLGASATKNKNTITGFNLTKGLKFSEGAGAGGYTGCSYTGTMVSRPLGSFFGK